CSSDLPGLGIIAGIIMLTIGLWYLQSRSRKASLAGEGYGDYEDDVVEDAPPEQAGKGSLSLMPLPLALLPLVLVIGVNALFTYVLFPNMSMTLITDNFPNVDPAKITGLWALIIALVIACTTLVISRRGHWESLGATINKGVFGFMLPLFNTA